MQKRYLIISLTIISIISFKTNQIYAQSVPGPSDAISAAPTAAADVNKIISSGQAILMTGPQDENGIDFSTYHWYKIDANGNKQLTTITAKKYIETTTTAGYYNYQLVTENINGCSSPISDVFHIYVLPALDLTVVAANNSICTNIGATVLTAKTILKNQNLTYQWYRNGVKIIGANSETYNVTGESTAAKIMFSVEASYVLNKSSSASANKEITITPVASKPMITAN